MIDGASKMTILFKIIFPLALPGIASVSILFYYFLDGIYVRINYDKGDDLKHYLSGLQALLGNIKLTGDFCWLG